MKELDIISGLKNSFPQLSGASLGIGDDCAYLKELGVLITTDTLVAGVHFLPDKVDYHLLGRKLISVSLSDIASMGGAPSYVTLNFNIPEGFSEENLNSLSQGIKEVSQEAGVKVIGGDTVRSGELSISATLIGSAPQKPIFRAGAKPGADIWVSGPLGYSALGLQIEMNKLEFELSQEDRASALKRFNNPSAQIELGQTLANEELALSMIDISDGLLTDLDKLLAKEALGAELDLENIPRAAPQDQTLSSALGGGEDYQLLFTAKTQNRAALESLPLKPYRIGHITGSGILRLKIEEEVLELAEAEEKLKISIKKGFEHNF